MTNSQVLKLSRDADKVKDIIEKFSMDYFGLFSARDRHDLRKARKLVGDIDNRACLKHMGVSDARD